MDELNGNDIKSARFKKIAENRTNNIISTLRLLGNCSNKNNYSYTDAQVKKIFSAIENELRLTKSKFDNNKDKFTL